MLVLGVLLAPSALAANVADLAVSLTPPAGVAPYETGTYLIQVRNLGRRTASGVELTVVLPETNTSPSTYLLGDLGTYDARCVLGSGGTSLVCSLGSLARNVSTAVAIELALPQSSAPLLISADATTPTVESTLANNSVDHVAALAHPALTVVDGDVADVDHCTGTGITSFFECALFPSSISSHAVSFDAGGLISVVEPVGTGVTGVWSQPSAERLVYSYIDGGYVVAEFDGWAVDASCFEGLTIFPGSTYVSPYRVCLR